jgi:toxin ParE1/3/4
MPRWVIRDPADADIDEIADFIAQDTLDAGRRFYDAVWHDLQRLAEMPRMGARRRSSQPRLVNLRSWPVSGYRNYLILYLASDDGIEVLRIIHGARDVDRIVRQLRP